MVSNKLPTREEAQRYLKRYYGNCDAANWHYAKNAAFRLIRGRADGILQTHQEFTDSLDATSMFMCWSIPAEHWMMRGHSAINGCNSRCGEVLIIDVLTKEER